MYKYMCISGFEFDLSIAIGIIISINRPTKFQPNIHTHVFTWTTV